MTRNSYSLPLTGLLAAMLLGVWLAGCSKGSSPDAVQTPGPPAAGAPTSSQVAAERAVAEQHMSQAREMAVAAWHQSHPGQKLPLGF